MRNVARDIEKRRTRRREKRLDTAVAAAIEPPQDESLERVFDRAWAAAVMREAAEENEHVLDDPHPIVSFEGFGDNSLTLLLRAYIDDLDLRVPTITALHKAINQKFNEAGIVIAFPQRDLHLDTTRPLQVELRRAKEDLADG